MADPGIQVYMPSLLQGASRGRLATRPYPYLVLRNAMPQAIYEGLSRTFPTLDAIPAGQRQANNKRLDLMSSWGKCLLAGQPIPDIWQAFFAAHSSPEFAQSVFDLFPHMLRKDDRSGDQHIRLDQYGPMLRDKLELHDPVTPGELVGRVTLGVNTPVRASTSVRGPHVDSPRKAYVGLYYLRRPEDDSTGGDLAIYRWKNGAVPDPWTSKAEADAVECADVVPYEGNTLVLMLCTAQALHGVTMRDPTPHERRLAIVSGWFPNVDPDNFARGSLTDMSGTAVRTAPAASPQ